MPPRKLWETLSWSREATRGSNLCSEAVLELNIDENSIQINENEGKLNGKQEQLNKHHEENIMNRVESEF